MKTPEFLRLLQHFPQASVDEAQAVITLKENFPFSQVLHTLSARVSKDHEFDNSQHALQMAAIYSADRGVLKDVMQASDDGMLFRPKPVQRKPVQLETADVASSVLEDLAKLHQLRQNFELLFTGGPVSLQTPVASVISGVTVDEPVVEEAEPPAIEENKESAKSKKERIVELAKALTAPVEDNVIQVEPGFKGRKRKKDAFDAFIDQIVVSKQELTPESDKHKEQIEIINQFIKVQPSITGSKDKQNQNNDLSTIKTGEFGDHIISETLVEILLKQGKKEKAVEVLKKLIWKFPQKKAYFAAQIEELRK